MAYDSTINQTISLLSASTLKDTREMFLVVGTFTKADSDTTDAIVTGLAELYSYGAQGNVVSKPMYCTVSGGTLTIGDDGSTGNTAGSFWAIGRK